MRPRATGAVRGRPALLVAGWIGYVLVLGVLARLPLLGLDSGVYDAAYFRNLMRAAVTDLPGVYTQVSPDYPPLSVLAFGLTAVLTRDTPPVVAAKLPEVIASLVLAALIGLVIWRRQVAAGQPAGRDAGGLSGGQTGEADGLLAGQPGEADGLLAGQPGEAGGLLGGQRGVAMVAGLAAAAYALNPGVVYVSAYWTQAEALWVLPIVLGLLALERGRHTLAWVAFAAAILTKPQAAAFVPLLLVATWRGAPWSVWLSGPAGALGLGAVVSAPWWLTGHAADVAQVYLGLSGADAWVSGSAYSLWYLLLLGRTHQVPADSPFLGDSLTYQHASWVLFGGLLAWVVWRASRRGSEAPSVYLSAATLWLGLAVLLTQTHERYFHPVLPLLLLAPELYRFRWRLPLVWLAVTLAYAYNLITVLPFDGFPGPSLIAEPGGGTRVLVLRGISLIAAATFLISLLVLALSLRRPVARANRSLGLQTAAALDHPWPS